MPPTLTTTVPAYGRDSALAAPRLVVVTAAMAQAFLLLTQLLKASPNAAAKAAAMGRRVAQRGRFTVSMLVSGALPLLGGFLGGWS